MTDTGMTDAGPPLGPDAHHMTWTARLYGWQVAVHADGSVRMSLPDRTLWAHFDPQGGFRHGAAAGPGCQDQSLDLREVLDTLAAHGNPGPPPPRR
ncbi:hypothetical protein [Yinghuangia sp. YIM S09857]|uniref:hypothetical protein n=1 Tax=Yinghuangia sp. YIM S09857 TaxID=3436929 RepID=UPI003F52BC77